MAHFLRFLVKFLASLSRDTAMALGRRLGVLFGAIVRRQRVQAITELTRCFPEKSPAEIRAMTRRMFENLGMNQVELFRWIGGRVEEIEALVTMKGKEHLDRAFLRGKGVIGLVAHIGNWDLMGLWGAKRFPLTTISKDLKNRGLNDFWMEVRRTSSLGIVPAHNSYRACLGVLKRNECLGFILDQNMIRREGIFVDFFGKPACTTPGMAVLAAHAGAPVVPVFMVRLDDGRHEIHVLPALEPPADRKPESVAKATQAYTKIIEDFVRHYPEQWIWMHRRWRTKPDLFSAPAAGAEKR
ncbi:MAG: lysophospholipid acyltransferase family protein [bacterium]